MLFEYIAISINTFAYFLPPFRQHGGRYFYYFLVLAIANPIGIFLILVSHVNPKEVICIFSWIAFVSLFNKNNLKNRYPLLIILTALLVYGTLSFDNRLVQIITIIINFLIMFHFIKEAAKYYHNNYTIHLGYFILTLYQIGLISKFYLAVSNINFGLLYYYLTDLFEILIAIFFTIYMVEKSPVIKLKRNVL